jgi:hypothetical protein
MNITGLFSFQFRFAGGPNTHHRKVREVMQKFGRFSAFLRALRALRGDFLICSQSPERNKCESRPSAAFSVFPGGFHQPRVGVAGFPRS